jgi:hypothetical protein
MAVATRTDTTLAATITQTSFVNALKTAFTSAGYSSIFDDYTSGTDRILVYAQIVDSSKVYGTVYLRIRITSSLAILQQIYTTWNPTARTGTGNSAEVPMITFATNGTVSFVSLDIGIEGRLVIISQGTLYVPLGIITPLNRPTWWDLNSWNYGFIFTSNSVNILRSTTVNPYGNTEYDTFLNNSRMGTPNTTFNGRDILTGIVLLSQSSTGVACRTSDDFGIGSCSGNARYDLLPVTGTTQQYLVINNVSGGLVIRVQ